MFTLPKSPAPAKLITNPGPAHTANSAACSASVPLRAFCLQACYPSGSHGIASYKAKQNHRAQAAPLTPKSSLGDLFSRLPTVWHSPLFTKRVVSAINGNSEGTSTLRQSSMPRDAPSLLPFEKIISRAQPENIAAAFAAVAAI